jgi:two-component system, NtrC family, sensor kinase
MSGLPVAAAFAATTAAIVFVVPGLPRIAAAIYVPAMLFVALAVLAWSVTRVLRRSMLDPLESMVSSVEAISEGDLGMRVPDADAPELSRLGTAVNQLAETLIADRQKLTENIQSLDETNRLLMEARDAMIRAETLASVGRLGAGIAHEVGNPLGAIIGYLGLVQRRTDGQARELAESAEREAQRIDRIIRGLLDFARPREAAAQPVDVNEVVRDTLELVGTQGHFKLLRLECSLAEDVPLMVTGDRYQLQQVLVNLLVNAADAVETVRYARVVVSTSHRSVRAVPPHVPTRRRDDPDGIDYSHRRRLARPPRRPEADPESDTGRVVEITVTDNGPGLPTELLEQIFEPFVTTKEPGKGTGLGLALCSRLIEGMHGVIRATNAPDGGAVFRVVLPAVAAGVEQT